MKYIFACLFLVGAGFAQEPTVQHALPLPFSYFENLYFDASSATFLGLGKDIRPAEAIGSSAKRGYGFQVTAALSQPAKRVAGTTLLLFEFPETARYLNHFFHLLEHVVGIWSFYGDLNREDVRQIVLCSDGNTAVEDWEGPNAINRHLLSALFPQARVMSWKAFLAEQRGALICFERAVSSDRALTLASPECAHLNKMLGVARHFLSPGSLQNLHDAIHTYAKTAPKPEGPFQITYLARTLPRTLLPAVEEKLLQALRAKEGVVVKKYDFSRLSFAEQVHIIGHTDLLISVHGNGLSHILFLPPTARVVEIYPEGSHGFDYQLLAEARHLPYRKIIAGEGVITAKRSYELGSFGNPNQPISQLDIHPILSFVPHNAPAKKRILIGSPIRQKPAILKEFLASLERLEKKSYTADYFFIEGNEDPESKTLLQAFAKEHPCLLIAEPPSACQVPYVRDETTHHWREEIIWKIAGFKDQMIQKAKDEGYDYLFLVDSDLVLHPRTVEQLIADQKEIITNNFWTKWAPNLPPLPQVWLLDHYTLFSHEIGEQVAPEEANRRTTAFLNQLKKPGVYEVGGLGACTLISRKALQKGVSFQRIKNLTFWGEDRHFCIRAVALGLSLHTDTHYPAYHIYRESELAGVETFRKGL